MFDTSTLFFLPRESVEYITPEGHWPWSRMVVVIFGALWTWRLTDELIDRSITCLDHRSMHICLEALYLALRERTDGWMVSANYSLLLQPSSSRWMHKHIVFMCVPRAINGLLSLVIHCCVKHGHCKSLTSKKRERRTTNIKNKEIECKRKKKNQNVEFLLGKSLQLYDDSFVELSEASCFQVWKNGGKIVSKIEIFCNSVLKGLQDARRKGNERKTLKMKTRNLSSKKTAISTSSSFLFPRPDKTKGKWSRTNLAWI